MYTYNPDDAWDRSIYRGPFSYYKNDITGKLTFEHSYEVVKDLKMPTSAERFDEFVDLYESNTKLFTKELTSVQKMMKGYSMGPQNVSAQNVNLKKLSKNPTDEDLVAAYKIFNHAMEDVSAFKMTKLYADRMAEKFDAMVDDNNQGVYNEAHDPIIIFRANEALKTVKDAQLNSATDIINNYLDVKRELDKKGKRVAL